MRIFSRCTSFLYDAFGSHSLLMIFFWYSVAVLTHYLFYSDIVNVSLVIIVLQVVELVYFALLCFVFLFAYGVANQSLLYPHSEDNWWDILYNIFHRPYLSLFQEFGMHTACISIPCVYCQYSTRELLKLDKYWNNNRIQKNYISKNSLSFSLQCFLFNRNKKNYIRSFTPTFPN